MSIAILRGDARELPLPDASVDLIVTSPPFYGLRDYRDGGASLDGQIGAEATPREYVDALLECTREWVRVLKRGGSIFVNLGDKYSGFTGPNWGSGRSLDGERGAEKVRHGGPRRAPDLYGIPNKSLMGLPWRFAIRCVDELGLTLRRDIIWSKTSGMPESVADRCTTRHEYVFHLVRQPRYYSAADEIREPHAEVSVRRAMPHRSPPGRRGAELYGNGASGHTLALAQMNHPLGKMPGSVWEISGQPLLVPAQMDLDHHAAFPMDLPRRCILGWSPPGICTACGEGRWPVVERPALLGGDNNPASRDGTRARSAMDGGSREWAQRISKPARITGYACACTPLADHEASGRRSNRRDRAPEATRPQGDYARKQAGEYERVGPWREYHLDGWTPPPRHAGAGSRPVRGHRDDRARRGRARPERGHARPLRRLLPACPLADQRPRRAGTGHAGA